jgi:hypothetical protein
MTGYMIKVHILIEHHAVILSEMISQSEMGTALSQKQLHMLVMQCT